MKSRVDNSAYIVTFSNENHFDTIFFGFDESSSKPNFGFINGYAQIAASFSPIEIQMNEWTHLAFTFDQNLNYRIYVNANLAVSSNSNQALKNTTRIFNYIGRGDNFPGDLYFNGIIDELKLFNRPLSQQEIQFEMNNNFY